MLAGLNGNDNYFERIDMFTRQHYKAIAEIIKEKSFEDQTCVKVIDADVLVSMLADYFAIDNPRFDRDKFLTACGL